MALQNLISATLEQQLQQEVIQQIIEVKSKLTFLLTMLPEDVRTLTKLGNQYTPFLSKAYRALQAHPEIMPAVFNTDEFTKDYLLIEALTPVANHVIELANCIQYTMLAAKSDAMSGALDIYAAVKQNQEIVLGLNVVADDMSAFFQRSSKKSAEKSQQSEPIKTASAV